MANSRSVHMLRYYYEKLSEALPPFPIDAVAQVVDLLDIARYYGHHVYVFGNGGSSATASHFASDLAKGASNKTKPKFRSHCLTDPTPVMTAWANDTEYANVFAGQLEGVAVKGDIAVAISVGGNSPNVVEGVRMAKELGVTSIAFVGAGRGKVAELADVVVAVPDTDTERVEDLHSVVCHSITYCLRSMG